MSGVTPEECLKFNGPTDGFLCKQSANIYGIEFMEFRVRELKTNKIFFHVRTPDDLPQFTPEELDELDDWETRFIRYDFPPKMLDLKTIGSALTFRVGGNEVPNFRMIERHYFRDQLLRSFDFKFGFCIPNSTNSWEVIYDLPKLPKSQKKLIISHPYETKSDSFYFVDDKLIMHNKAEYSYNSKD